MIRYSRLSAAFCGLAAAALFCICFAGNAAAEAPLLRCRTVERSAPPGEDNQSFRNLGCPEGEFLAAAKQFIHDGRSLCAVQLDRNSETGRTTVDAGCSTLPRPLHWVLQLTCCKAEGLPGFRLDCRLLRRADEKGMPAGERLARVACSEENETLLSAQSYLLPSGRGNCPLRWYTESGAAYVSAGDCPAPSDDQYWAVDYICCTPRSAASAGGK